MSDTIIGTGFKKDARPGPQAISRRVKVALDCLDDAKRMLADRRTAESTRAFFGTPVIEAVKELERLR